MEEAKKPESAGSKKKREDKIRRRDCRALDNVLKELNNRPEPERFDALTTKYGELYEDYRTCHSSLAISEKRCTVLLREKDQLQSEQSKLVLARSRMESLCRELQRQNKLIKDENLAKIREEEERRKEVAAKFQMTLNEVTNMMQENTEKNIKLRDDNLDMASKIENLYEQFEKRKEHQTKMEQQIALERQLAQAQIEKAQLEHKAEREMWTEERKALQDKILKGEENCLQLQKTVKGLQEHLELYLGKYQEFKSSISKSNQVFDDCKSEMGKLTKQIVTLEKEVETWKQRSLKDAQVALELSAVKQVQDAKLEATDRKLEQMQKLCRQLQADRSSYLKLLKTNGIEPVSQPCEEEPVNNNQKNLTKKEKELAHLKENLKVLQDQLAVMQTTDNTINENGTPVSNEPATTDTIRNDTVTNDTVTNDTVTNDTVTNDTVTNDTVPNDSVTNEIVINENATYEIAANDMPASQIILNDIAALDLADTGIALNESIVEETLLNEIITSDNVQHFIKTSKIIVSELPAIDNVTNEHISRELIAAENPNGICTCDESDSDDPSVAVA